MGVKLFFFNGGQDVYEDTACNAKPTDCDWVTTGSGADEEGFCVGKGKAVPCSAFLPEHCPKDTCTFNSEDYACVSKNYIAPCIEYGAFVSRYLRLPCHISVCMR